MLVDNQVDGNQAVLVDLSTLGAQLVSATVLKPSQRVRMALFDAQGRSASTLLWRGPRSTAGACSAPRYRAGIEFIDANPAAVDASCARQKNWNERLNAT